MNAAFAVVITLIAVSFLGLAVPLAACMASDVCGFSSAGVDALDSDLRIGLILFPNSLLYASLGMNIGHWTSVAVVLALDAAMIATALKLELLHRNSILVATAIFVTYLTTSLALALIAFRVAFA